MIRPGISVNSPAITGAPQNTDIMMRVVSGLIAMRSHTPGDGARLTVSAGIEAAL